MLPFNFVYYVFFCYVYLFLLLCMFRSGYSVSLCCSVYYLCANVYCTTATGLFVVVFLELQPIVIVFSQPGSELQPPRFWGFLITHNDSPQSLGLPWTSDQSVAETPTWQHTTLTTDKYPCPGAIRTYNLSMRAASDLRLRPRGHWDRHCHRVSTQLQLTIVSYHIISYIFMCRLS